MPKSRLIKTVSLVAAATGVAAAGLVIPAPALALPPLPLAPVDCQQFEFAGDTNIKLSTGPILTFNANGPGVNGPASDNRADSGTVIGGIAPNRHVDLTFRSTAHPEDPELHLVGDVKDDGRAGGNWFAGNKGNGTWETPAPLACPQAAAAKAAPKEGPSVDLDPGIGTLTIRVTDKSGVASNCQYHSDFVDRTFDLPANGTFNINVAPAVPMFIDHQVDVTCTNGTSTHTTKFF